MPYCNANGSGWASGGPLPIDFSSCFSESVVQNVPALMMLVAGPARLWYLCRKARASTSERRQPQNAPAAHKARLFVAALLVLVSAATLVLAVITEAHTQSSVLVSTTLAFATAVIAVVLVHFEYTVLHAGSALLSVFWLFKWLAGILSIRTYVNAGVPQTNPAYFALFTTGIACAFLASVLELVQPAPRDGELPEPHVSVFSRLTFWWMNPLIRQGAKAVLTMDDMYKVHPKMVSQTAHATLQEQMARSPKLSVALFWSMLARYWPLAMTAMASRLIALVLTLVSPQIMGNLIEFVQSYRPGASPMPVEAGYFNAALMFLSTLLLAVFTQQSIHCCAQLSIRMRVAYTDLIYRKALRLSVAGKREANIGKVVNLMSTDAPRVTAVINSLNDIWASPATIVFAMYFLWKQLGPASLAGVVFVVGAGWVLGKAAGQLVRIRAAYAKVADQRVKSISEGIAAMKIVKLFTREALLSKSVRDLFQQEVGFVSKLFQLYSALMAVTNNTSVLMSLISFGVYAAVAPANAPFTAQRVFVSLSYFQIIAEPLSNTLSLADKATSALVAYRRIVAFMKQDEVDQAAVIRVQPGQDSRIALSVSKGSFVWRTDQDSSSAANESEESTVCTHFQLTDVDLSVSRGQRVAIIGRVGDGKSSLLHALLGEMIKLNGEVHVNGSVSYAAQSAWIFNGTLRDNILFGLPLDQERYHTVLHACSLLPDLDVLPDGDQTAIGDKGVSLSGGQKGRVSLARAVYAETDIVLLDDSLSAVDAHVDRHIFQHVLSSQGLLAGRTVIMATHGIHHLSEFDHIIHLKDGQIAEQGTYDHLMQLAGPFKQLIETYAQGEHPGQGDIQRGSSGTGQGPVQAASKTTSPVAKLKADDDSLTGVVDWSVYKLYLRQATPTSLLLTAVVGVLSLLPTVGSALWLLHMSAGSSSAMGGSMQMQIGVYAAIVGVQVAVGIANFNLITVFLARSASSALHSKLLRSVLRAPMQWFDNTPAGRIISRFSADIQTISGSLPVSLLNSIGCGKMVVSSLILVGLSAPWVLVMLPILAVVMYYIQRFYLASNREIQRLDSSSTAPVYQLFEESLVGVVTVRAYNHTARHITLLEERLDRKTRANYMNSVTSRWLSFTLDSISLVSAFMNAVVASCGLETDMVSVERIKQYIDLPSEAPEHTIDLDAQWPPAGRITFRNYSTSYKSGDKPVLDDITLDIKAGQKIGICGRTGAGKSTITLALFRILEAVSGSIEIDGQDISKLGLIDLRNSLTIIPQDPVLFAGTIRSNLDPRDEFDDATIWSALERIGMDEYILKLEGKLRAEVSSDGSNFSAGQRQLLAMAMALLRKRRVVIFDEATSATDAETDALVQKAIRSEFSDCTVLTIAHRLATIMDSDRILVLDKGCVSEFDSPANLLQNPESAFASMVASSQGH
ncbi:hypothetical protein RI367_005438 [Sorochytrium milnesiophthora]